MPIPIEMPKLSDTMTEGVLVKWRKKEGDPVQVGDVLAEVETDKATMEMEAFDEGTLGKILVAEGAKIAIGSQIAILLEPGEDAAALNAAPAPASSSQSSPSAPTAQASTPDAAETHPAPSSTHPASAPTPGSGRVKASPLAKKVAAQHGVDLRTISGSGPGGRIVAQDVLVAATSAGGSKPTPPADSAASKGSPTASKPAAPISVPVTAGAGDRKVELSGMRRTIADRLLASKTQIPHFYLTISVDAGPLSKLRKQINDASAGGDGPKITVNDFVLLAAARSAAAHPKVNASWAHQHVVEYADVNLAVAVAIDDGLITPVLRKADKLSLRELSAAVKDIATRARGKKLKPEEYQGGTITVSNLGAYGIEQFCAIINPPQALILAVGAIVKQPVVNERDEIVVGQRMAITLSGDHRVVDGAVGAEYLQTLRKLLENPALMLF